MEEESDPLLSPAHPPFPSGESQAARRWKLVKNSYQLWRPHHLRRRVSTLIDKRQESTAAVLLPNIIKSSWRHRIAFYLDSTRLGRLWEIMDVVLNAGLALCYVWNATYYDERLSPSYLLFGLPFAERAVEFSFAFLLLLSYLPKIYIAVDPWRNLVSSLTILTFFACIPVIVAFCDDARANSFMSSGWLAYLYPCRFMRLHLAITVCLVPSKTSIIHVSLIGRKAIQLLGFLFFLFCTVATFLHVGTHLSRDAKDVSFFDALYYAFVSTTSGSASQIIQDSPFSRLIIIGVIISAAVFVPTNLAELLRLIANKSFYDHSFKEKRGQNHVVICGHFELNSLETFLKEFFCPDHGQVTVNTHVVVLNPREPTDDLKAILSDPMYINRVQYVVGNVMNPRSLEKVRINEAKACFVFSSKYASDNASEEDAATVMRALALKKQVVNVPLHVQVLMPEHKVHFDRLADTIVCVEELKLGLLAQNCRCPGFSTLMHMLTTSVTEETAKTLLKNVSVRPDSEWIEEYLEGANQEIYATVLSAGFAGMTFAEASAAIYAQFGAVVFALGVPGASYKHKLNLRENLDKILAVRPDLYESISVEAIRLNASDFDLYLNPAGYELQGGELAFLVGSEEDIARQISEFCPADIVDFEAGGLSHIRSLFAAKGKTELSPIDELKPKSPMSPNHKIIVREISAENYNSLTPNDVKALLGTEGIVSSMTSPRMNVMPNQGLGTSRSDALPVDLFEDDSRDSSLEMNDTRDASSSSARFGMPEASNIVTRILGQAVGLTSKTRSRTSTARSSVSTDQTDDSTFVEPLTNLKDHIIICDAGASFPANLEYFIAPLRSPHLQHRLQPTTDSDSSWAPIVILSPAEPSVHQRDILMKFSDVYIIRGSPMRRRDLRLASVETCKKAVILTDSKNGKYNAERTADASSLLVVLNIEALATTGDIFVITECVYEDNMMFIGPSDITLKTRFKEREGRALMRPAFMSGHVYCQSMLDSIICQNFFNPHMLNIVRHMLFSGSFESQTEKKGMHSHMWLVKLSSVLVGTRYSELVRFFALEHSAVAMGLYRMTGANPTPAANVNASGVSTVIQESMDEISHALSALGMDQMFGSQTKIRRRHHQPSTDHKDHHRYVYLNPAPNTKIRHGDCVYLLCHQRPNL
eukprot:Partr_v1_DN28856_c0_g1_i3_m33832 putative Potassium large conductance calcium-activated channel, subfamily M, alpha member 1